MDTNSTEFDRNEFDGISVSLCETVGGGAVGTCWTACWTAVTAVWTAVRLSVRLSVETAVGLSVRLSVETVVAAWETVVARETAARVARTAT